MDSITHDPELEDLRNEIFRRTGQKVDLDDPIFAVIVAAQHGARREAAAAQDEIRAELKSLDGSERIMARFEIMFTMLQEQKDGEWRIALKTGLVVAFVMLIGAFLWMKLH